MQLSAQIQTRTDPGPVLNQKPETNEHSPSHGEYINEAPAGDLLETLGRQPGELAAMLSGLSPDRWRHRYAEGKWSVLEVLGHLVDGERIQMFRAMHVARGDQNPLPGWEENDYMRESHFEEFQSGPSLLDQFVYLRSAHLGMLKGLPPETLMRRGTVNNISLTARAAIWVLAGHTQHHMNILKERYGL
ncbi:MAG: DinB family protein [Acidobacteriaceae bacterium]